MTIQVTILEDAPIVLIKHTTQQGGMPPQTRRQVREDVYKFIRDNADTFVIADFSSADWTFAEQVQALGFMIDHFRELGGVDFLRETTSLIIVGESDVAQTIAMAVEQEQYGGLSARIVATRDEAIKIARSHIS